MRGIYSNESLTDYKSRIQIAVYLSTALLVILFLRFFYLQILRGGKLLEFSEQNRINIKTVRALRGKILDRKGRVIADNRPSFDLALVRGYTSKTPQELLGPVRSFLDWEMNEDEYASILTKVRSGNRYDPTVVKKDISRDELASIVVREYWLDGIRILEQPVRYYPYGTLMSHPLGYLGEIDEKGLKKMQEEKPGDYRLADYIGLFGVEKLSEEYLKGLDGAIPFVEDAKGRELGEEASMDLLPAFRKKEPKPGNNVWLTIDLDLQKITEEAFDKESGAAIVIDPNSGEILAMLSRPAFEPGLFTRGVEGEYWRKLMQDPKKPLYDRALKGRYPPGSTFKVITAIAALAEKVIDPSFKFNCKGSYRLGRETKRCWKTEGHGVLDLRGAIVHSCDAYFYELGRRVGIDRIAKYARMFGLGTATGLGMNSEANGLVPDSGWKMANFKVPWVEGETLSVAVGQGFVTTTPMQMVSLYSALANGGRLFYPNIVWRVEDYNGNLKIENRPRLKSEIGIDQKILDFVKDGLSGVVNEAGGTAYWTVRSKLAMIAGKTGTAQVARLELTKGKGGALQDHAWFICFAPYEKPEIAVVVLVEHGGHGSSASGPIAKKIVEGYMKLKEGAIEKPAPGRPEVMQKEEEGD